MFKKYRKITGFRPSGNIHLGHYAGCLKSILDEPNKTECYFLIADIHAGTKKYVLDIVKDLISIGVRGHIYLQSECFVSHTLTLHLANLLTVARLNRVPVIKETIQNNLDLTYGFWMYPIGQTADILSIRANKVYIGEDQRGVIELSKELRARFNRVYNEELFPTFEIEVGKKILGYDGNKMSKSLNNSILLTDSLEEITKKVNAIPTSSTKNIERNLVFSMLEHVHDNVDMLRNKYKNSDWGDKENKIELIKALDKLIKPWREKRKTIHDYEAQDRLNLGNQHVKRITAPLFNKLKTLNNIEQFNQSQKHHKPKF